jgi:hypothetical protein
MAALQEAKNRVASPFTVHAKTWSNRKDYRDLILLHCISMSLCGSSCKKEKKEKKEFPYAPTSTFFTERWWGQLHHNWAGFKLEVY